MPKRYSETIFTTFELYPGITFKIRKISPLRLKDLEELKDKNDNESIEKGHNIVILAGVVEPKLTVDGLKILIEGEQEEVSYDDKLKISNAINCWSGLTEEGRLARQKFREDFMGKHGGLVREKIPQTTDRNLEAAVRPSTS